MSTYSPSLRIELITTGDQAGTWGVTTNTNLGTLLEDAISGYTSVSITSADQALTALNGVADQSRNQTIALTTTTTANFNVYAPPAEKTYIIYNASSYTATIYNSTVIGNTTAAGTGVAIPAGKTFTVWSDGTNFAAQINHLPSLSLTTDLAVADGGTGASTAADARTNLGLGTLATQNSSSVTITGGSITGITDLAVADGGTGSSTASGARTNLGAAASGANSDITSITGLTTALAVNQGGTGQTTANAAFNALAPSQSSQSGKYLKTDGTNTSWDQIDISTADITGTLPIANGGTGATTAANARTGLGLGTIATQNSSSVSITGGSITGITDLAVADGGTGASSFTSGGILRGNGTSALSVASAADITAAIGSTAVTNATNATNATKLVTANFTIEQSGTKLLFKYGTTTVASLDSSGNWIVDSDVTAYGTP